MPNKPTDQALYDLIKNKVCKKNKINSAYRSGQIVKQYKTAYKKKHNKTDAYQGTKTKEGLTRWYKEEWRTQGGSKTYKKDDDIFRPTNRVSEKTPTTMGELSNEQIKRAMEEKEKTGRVKKF